VKRLLYALAYVLFLYGPAYSGEIAIGDSIAVGLNLPGSAQVGISPKEVVRRIAMTPLNDLHNNIIILSTGLSNDPTDDANTDLELRMLAAVEAKHVVLLGVGVEVSNSMAINQWLKSIAEYNGWIYIDGWQKVHPDYRALKANIAAYVCMAHWQCDI
jgi:hypothetical protein